jgi:hypothetical protein
MTELEWLTWSKTPTRMLSVLGELQGPGRTQEGRRRLRLFACACARRLGPLLEPLEGLRTIEKSERFADGLVAPEFWRSFQEVAPDLQKRFQPLDDAGRAIWDTIRSAPGDAAVMSARHACLALAGDDWERMKEELAAQCDLVRCIFGNPFSEVKCNPAPYLQWGAGTVPRLAEAIYKEGAFDRLPILGDALEEAGCTEAAILEHCRQRACHNSQEHAPHARGCWVIDWVRSAGKPLKRKK